MKTYIKIAIITSVLVVAGISAAQAQNAIITFNVPFEFTVAGDSLSRDTYQVSRASGQSGTLLVRSARGGVFVVGQTSGWEDTGETPQLVFHRYGRQNFLREIRFSEGFGVSLPETREEREVAERRADRSADLDTVVVLAQRR